jgi:ABC-type sugar transport system ATPase subunit
MINEYILEVKDIVKGFTGVLALDKVNFQLRKGEIHGLVGENGAGKSTLIKIISGILKEDNGLIFLNNENIKIKNVASARDYGIAYVPQEIELNDHLSVADNIFIGRYPSRFGIINFKELNKKADDVKALLGDASMKLDNDLLVSSLDIANKQLIEILKIFVFDAKVLCLDEPTSSLTGKETDTLLNLLVDLKNKGISIIYVSHFLDEVFRIADRITIFKDGQNVDTLNKEDTTVEEVAKLMVGRNLSFLNRIDRSQNISENNVLEVNNLSRKDKVKKVGFKLRKGEILGWFGLVGSGRTETARILFGIDNYDTAEIKVFEEKSIIKNTSNAIDKKIGMVPEDRHNQGLILSMDVKSNINMSKYGLISKFGFIRLSLERINAKKFVNNLNIKAPSINTIVETLSGGNQQKVSIAKWLNRNSEILILDEPTKGIDIGSKNEIYKLIRELADKGKGIIFISSELPEILNLSDRILVFKNGEIVKEFLNPAGLEEYDILKYAI